MANAAIQSTDISETPRFVPTFLTNSSYTSVTGGQRLGLQLVDDKAIVISGLVASTTIVQADIAIAGGSWVHIIDSALSIPPTVSAAASAAGLSELASALEATDLLTTLNSASDITIFAPSNAAFDDTATDLATLSTAEAAAILGYHVVEGTVAYSSLLSDSMSVTSSTGQALSVTIDDDGQVFVNQARVIQANVLVAGGVVHVIDSVLDPNGAAVANPDSDEPVVAFSGASYNPTTASGVPAPTTGVVIVTTEATASASQAALVSGTSSGGAAAMATGALGAAALFGGGVAALVAGV